MTEDSKTQEHGSAAMKYDVVVAGGGTAGCAAALAAARKGAKTLLLERNGALGGTATSGLMVSWGVSGRFWDGFGEQVMTGIPWEIHRELVARGSGHPAALKPETAPYKMVFEPEDLKGLLIDLLLDAKVDILTHTMACDPVFAGRVVKGLYIENKSGRQMVEAPQYIDCTGDLDVCRRAEIHRCTYAGGHSLMMRVGGVNQDALMEYVKAHRDRVDTCYGGDYSYNDIVENYDNRGYLLIFGFARSYWGNLSVFADIYEQAIRDGVFTEQELLFHDYAAKNELKDGMWGVDIQGIEGTAGTDIVDIWAAGRCFNGCDARAVSKFEMVGHRRSREYFHKVIKRLPGFEKAKLLEIAADAGVRGGVAIDCEAQFTKQDLREGTRQEDCIGRFANFAHFMDADANVGRVRGADIPLRMLIPKQADNLLVAGRFCGVLRAMTSCMVMGQGAGIAAALAAERGCTPRGLPAAELRSAAKAQGVNVGCAPCPSVPRPAPPRSRGRARVCGTDVSRELPVINTKE